QRRSMLPGGRPRQRGQVNGLVALSYGVGFVGVIHRTSDSFFGADVMHELFGEASLRLLLDHFGDVGDPREAAKVKYPLRVVLFLDMADQNANECAFMLSVMSRLPLTCALVMMNAIVIKPPDAATLVEGGCDNVLAIKRNLPSMRYVDVRYIADAATPGV